MNNNREFRVAIADDHPVIRQAVVNAIENLPGFAVGANAHSGQELLDRLTEGSWDLIVTDLSMQSTRSETDGLNLVASLCKRHPSVPVIVFTMLNNDDVLLRLSRSGVAGIVDKCEGIAEFQSAILQVVNHQRPFFSERIRSRLRLRCSHAVSQGGAHTLTKKELDVIRYFAAGVALTQIAQRVNRSISTVATQKSAAMKKLGLQTNADLVKYAQENGLI
ncbi:MULTISPECIES: response regulator transcription factor [Paraburkholderia]|jgi:two-component system capsular synthesis response regulator RcsB|nr:MULTISPECIES: response regulator transcription factor [Paraburkholderia]GJH33050.1 response regulator [Paraburkholderia hospita]CAG9267798.1 DNA-binding response regulator [Paraburkholderia caribensis]